LTTVGVVVGGVFAFLFVGIALFLIGRDFAGRRQADATVRRQAELLDLARDAIFVCDMHNRVLYWNQGSQRLYGWSADEALGKKAYELLATQFPVPLAEVNRQLLDSGHWTGELTHTTRDGRTLTIESHWSLRRDKQGQPEAVLGINDDITQRKQAEADLRAAYENLEARVRERTAALVRSNQLLHTSEQQYAGIVGSAIDGIVTVDEDQRIVLFNAAAEKMFGYTASEMLGQSLQRLMPVRYQVAHAVHVKEFGRTGNTLRAMKGAAVLSGVRANGEEFPLEVSISKIEIEGRKLFTAVHRDITDRVAAERVQSRLAAIIESSDDAIVSKTLGGIIASWNDGAQRLFGYTADEIVGESIAVIIPADRAREEDMIIGKIALGQTVRHYETVRLRKDGSLIDISVTVSPIRGAGGIVIGASKIARDISARKRAENKLRESEQEIRTVTNAIPSLIAHIDRGQRYRFANKAYQEWFAVAQDEIIGMHVEQVLGAPLYREIAPYLAHALAGRPVRFESVQLHRAGGGHEAPRVFHVNYIPSRGPDGGLNGAFVVAHDITELKRAEESMLRTQKMDALGTLAGGIAHDFNNLLPAILGYANLAEGELPHNHPARGSLAEIKKASKRAGDLVRNILTFSRPQKHAATAVELAPVVTEAITLARTMLPQTIELRAALAPAVPAVCADATQIYQIVINLVTNASDAIGPQGGVIDVKLETTAPNADIQGLGAGRYAQLTVSDNGCGMDRETQRRIFDPFFTTKAPGKGTGLGMSIVSSIVSSVGGTVNVYSEPGQGSRFTVYVPVMAGATPDRVAARGDVMRGHGERILYLDDEEPLVFLVTRVLTRLGYAVSGHTDARDALKAFRADPHAFDAVISDVSMPGMSGYDFARELAAIRPGVPVILASGYVRPEDEEHARAVGAREMMLKPNEIEEFGAAIARLLHARPG
jgi:PAS domain S-box-containing protein